MADIPSVYIELVDPPDDALDSWRKWADDVYIPALLKVGGVRAVRRGEGYQNADQQAIKDAPPVDIILAELRNASVAESDAWRQAVTAAAETDPKTAEIHEKSSRPRLYEQILSTVDDYVPREGPELLHGAFYEMPTEYHDEFNDWYNTEHVPIQMTVPGYNEVRRFQGVHEKEAFVALYDVDKAENTRGDAARAAMESAWSDRIRDKLARRRARRLFLIKTVAVADR